MKMLKKINQKLNIQKIPIFCFYGSFLIIIFSCLIETVTYPGIFLNKTGTSLTNIANILGIICLFSYFQLELSNIFLKYKKILIICSLFFILVTIIFVLLESFNYPNFVFSKFHINYNALKTLSLFSFIFLISSLITKFDLKKIFNKKSKILIIGILFFTPILSYFSWSQHLTNNNITSSETILLPSAKNIFIFLKDTQRVESLKDQFTWFFKTTNNYSQYKIFFNLITISLSTIFFIVAILFYLNWLQYKKSSKIGRVLLIFYIGGIAYSILIILICVKMFSLGELKVFQGRYVLTYVLSLLMFSFYLFLNKFKKQKKINKISILYLIIIFLMINITNVSKLKPVNKEIFLKRKTEESFFLKVREELKNNKNKPILHTINGDGAINYNYFLTPFTVITPIWQEWDVFMLRNPGFKKATHVFLPSASDVMQKWADPQIEKMFVSKNFVTDNALYKIMYETEDKSSFHLELIKKF